MPTTKTSSLLVAAMLAAAPATPLAAQGVLTFDVAVEFKPPPDDRRPLAALELRARLQPPPDDDVPPPDDTLVIELQPPDPLFPPDPCTPPDPCQPPDPAEPVWEIRVPAGCFEAVDRRGYEVRDPAACGAGIAQIFADGTSLDLSRFLTAFDARLTPPPDDSLPWILRLELATDGLPAQNQPPDPVLGSIGIQSGDATGKARNGIVTWNAATSPSADDLTR